MARTINQRELRNQSGEIMRALDRGESFIVTRNGAPVGELRPIEKKPTFIQTEVLLEKVRGSGPIDYEEFRADLDAVADQSIDLRE